MDNVRYTMSDDARLTAAGAGENQYRAFGGLDCFALLGVKAGKEIHGISILASDTVSMAWTRVAKVVEILPWSVIQHTHAGARYAICNVDGDIRAVSGICPHQDGPLYEGMLDEDTIMCPLHAWKFDTRSGACDADETLRIAVYPVKVENGVIFADLPERNNA